jgi:hypothetical protein
VHGKPRALPWARCFWAFSPRQQILQKRERMPMCPIWSIGNIGSIGLMCPIWPICIICLIRLIGLILRMGLIAPSPPYPSHYHPLAKPIVLPANMRHIAARYGAFCRPICSILQRGMCAKCFAYAPHWLIFTKKTPQSAPPYKEILYFCRVKTIYPHPNCFQS